MEWELAFKLLEEVDVKGFQGLSLTEPKDELTLETFQIRYDEAFIEGKVVVAVQSLTRQLFIVESAKQLFENISMFQPQGIDMVLSIPEELWNKTRPTVTRRIHDLATVPD